MSVRGDESRSSDKIDNLRREAASCRACPLWKDATQTVFGEGPPDAEIMLVGEQPGDREDREGRPFVGPAGLLLDRALADAGVDRKRAYVTNAVKHFKFEPRGSDGCISAPTQAKSGYVGGGCLMKSRPSVHGLSSLLGPRPRRV
jgi:uracil-DNA glycosylase